VIAKTFELGQMAFPTKHHIGIVVSNYNYVDRNILCAKSLDHAIEMTNGLGLVKNVFVTGSLVDRAIQHQWFQKLFLFKIHGQSYGRKQLIIENKEWKLEYVTKEIETKKSIIGVSKITIKINLLTKQNLSSIA
jgi:hypothetical protein